MSLQCFTISTHQLITSPHLFKLLDIHSQRDIEKENQTVCIPLLFHPDTAETTKAFETWYPSKQK